MITSMNLRPTTLKRVMEIIVKESLKSVLLATLLQIWVPSHAPGHDSRTANCTPSSWKVFGWLPRFPSGIVRSLIHTPSHSILFRAKYAPSLNARATWDESSSRVSPFRRDLVVYRSASTARWRVKFWPTMTHSFSSVAFSQDLWLLSAEADTRTL